MPRKVGVKSEGSKWVLFDARSGVHLDVCETEKEAKNLQRILEEKK